LSNADCQFSKSSKESQRYKTGGESAEEINGIVIQSMRLFECCAEQAVHKSSKVSGGHDDPKAGGRNYA
jgi:hypothetical protein